MNSKLEKISCDKKEKKYEREDCFSEIWKKNWDIFKIHIFIFNKLNLIDIQKDIYINKIKLLECIKDPYIQLEVYRLRSEIEYLSIFPSCDNYQSVALCYLYQSEMEEDKDKIKEIRNNYLREFYFIYYPLQDYNYKKADEKNIKSECCSDFLDINKESYWFCISCGLIYDKNIENKFELQSYNDMKEMIPGIRKKPVYKKAGHLQEKLNQKLSHCKNFIPEDVLEKVKKQIKNEKILDLSKLKPEDIRRILKKLGLEKYYEMDYNIFSHITGTKIIQFDSALINKIEQMFDEVVLAFENIKNKNRTSMFVYDYTIHKLLELLDLNIYKRYFKPPKNPEKVIDYDRLWKKICIQLSWKFIPTSINCY